MAEPLERVYIDINKSTAVKLQSLPDDFKKYIPSGKLTKKAFVETLIEFYFAGKIKIVK